MPQRCSICIHPKRKEIEQAIAAGKPSRRILAVQFGSSVGSLGRHATSCITKAMKAVREGRQVEHGAVTVEAVREAVRNGAVQSAITIENELHRCFERINKLFDACDDYLADPSDPTNYTLNPRSDEVKIVWEELQEETKAGAKPVWVKKSGTLQEALDLAFANGHRRLITSSTAIVKRADIRELILSTAQQLSRQIEIMAKLEGRYRPVETPLGQAQTVQLATIINILNLGPSSKYTQADAEQSSRRFSDRSAAAARRTLETPITR